MKTDIINDVEEPNDDFDLFRIIAREQVREILTLLQDSKKLRVNPMAKKLNSTPSQVSRNVSLLEGMHIIQKDKDASYYLTVQGKQIYLHIQSFDFLINHRDYFQDHDLINIPLLFKQSLGSLKFCTYIDGGFHHTDEMWYNICENAKKFVKNILIDIPYTDNMMKIISEKAKANIPIYSIFSESASISPTREKLLTKYEFDKLFKDEIIQRRVNKDVRIMLCFNEKESLLMFPKNSGDKDFEKAFYSKNSQFHDWCESIFEYYWTRSQLFREGFWKQKDKK